MVLQENIGFVQFLFINQWCLLLGDSVLCEIYILLKLIDCIVKAALNHVNFNLAKMTKLSTKAEKIFQLIIYTLFKSPSTSTPPPPPVLSN